MNNTTVKLNNITLKILKNILDTNKYYSSQHLENLKLDHNFKSSITQLFNKTDLISNRINEIKGTNKKLYYILKLFYLNDKISNSEMRYFLSENEIELLLKDKIVEENNGFIVSNYRIIAYNKKYFLTEKINKDHASNHVYAGLDTYLLLDKLMKETQSKSKLKILEVGTGPGTISISMIERANEIVACDINTKAIEFANMNLMMNYNSNNKIKIIQSDYKNILKNEDFDLIISNPPFIPVPKQMKNTFPIYGYGGDTGLEFVNELIENYYNSNSKKIFIITASGGKNQGKIFEILNKYDLKITADVVLELGIYSFLYHSHIKKDEIKMALENFKENGFNRFYYYILVIEKGEKQITINRKYKSSKFFNFLTEIYFKNKVNKIIKEV